MDRSWAHVFDCAASASFSSASAASSGDKMFVSSSMILTWTGRTFPAAKAANVLGSRSLTRLA
jgi:hypothetical protein